MGHIDLGIDPGVVFVTHPSSCTSSFPVIKSYLLCSTNAYKLCLIQLQDPRQARVHQNTLVERLVHVPQCYVSLMYSLERLGFRLVVWVHSDSNNDSKYYIIKIKLKQYEPSAWNSYVESRFCCRLQEC